MQIIWHFNSNLLELACILLNLFFIQNYKKKQVHYKYLKSYLLYRMNFLISCCIQRTSVNQFLFSFNTHGFAHSISNSSFFRSKHAQTNEQTDEQANRQADIQTKVKNTNIKTDKKRCRKTDRKFLNANKKRIMNRQTETKDK